ncbi:MAG: pyridoxal phosphate-dependent aminotransferase [Lentisphaeria bacterium]|nr:pyridoxal phosphate-dependent aminotransferase [Lentisphaeria bacterium]NQZ67104.1 pyridoxal phosphate-dependent aminotransferase [Lentisphaeria bacterium]
MTNHISKRMLDVQSPMIAIVGELIAANPGTISLGQGIVHFDPPRFVGEHAAASASLQRSNRYGLVSGIDELIERIGTKLAEENNISVSDKQRIIVTAGSNMGFQNTILSIADPGDEIIIQSPYYFNHEMAIAIANCQAVVVPTDQNYQPNIAALEAAITDRTRAIITVSPNNPTGAVYSDMDLIKINQLCQDAGIYHISDEAYEYFVYDGAEHFSAASITNSESHTISLFTLSKAYGMAGWRVGYMLIPEHLEAVIKKVQDTNLICPPIISQLAACAALDAGKSWCDGQISGFNDVRQLVMNELSVLQDKLIVPDVKGAFYVLMKLRKETGDLELVKKLIEDYGVAVMPGSTFGVDDGTYLRIAYGALARDSVEDGMGRLVNGLKALL